jgi:peptidoglycan/LPS O-acetylase OafA/YrhL
MALMLSNPSWRKWLAGWLSVPVWVAAVAVLVADVAYVPPFAMLWRAIVIPIILAGTILHPKSAVGMVLELAPVRWLGRISYSLYLWQQLFLPPDDVSHPLGALQAFPLNLVSLFGCAILSYYLIERPLIRFGRSLETRIHQIPSRAQTVAEAGTVA